MLKATHIKHWAPDAHKRGSMIGWGLLSPPRIAPIGRNWGPCDIINISLIENLSLIETLGPCGRQIVNRCHRKPRDHSITTELSLLFIAYISCYLQYRQTKTLALSSCANCIFIFTYMFGRINKRDLLILSKNCFSFPELLGLTPLYPGTDEFCV
jgi:hypothetical protein